MKRRDASERDAELARLLAAGMTQEQAGKRLGMSRATVTRRLRDPGFNASVRAARTAQTESILEHLERAAMGAVVVLMQVLANPAERTADRIKAAGLVFAAFDRRTVPSQVQLSGQVDVADVSDLTEDQADKALTALAAALPEDHPMRAEIAGLVRSGEVPALPAAVSRSEPLEAPDDRSPVPAAESVPAPQEASGSDDSADDVPEPEASEDAVPQNVVPLPPPRPWQPDPALTGRHNPWRRKDPASTSLWPG